MTTAKKPTILLVDNDPEALDVLIDALREAGYDTEVATTGERALHWAGLTAPDLILGEAELPDLEKFGLVDAVAAAPHLGAIPVVFLAGLEGEENRLRGLRTGALDYIHKPVSSEEVVVRVGKYLEIIAARRRLEETLAALERELAELRERLSKVQQIHAHALI